jgi:hypothetical protein
MLKWLLAKKINTVIYFVQDRGARPGRVTAKPGPSFSIAVLAVFLYNIQEDAA